MYAADQLFVSVNGVSLLPIQHSSGQFSPMDLLEMARLAYGRGAIDDSHLALNTERSLNMPSGERFASWVATAVECELLDASAALNLLDVDEFPDAVASIASTLRRRHDPTCVEVSAVVAHMATRFTLLHIACVASFGDMSDLDIAAVPRRALLRLISDLRAAGERKPAAIIELVAALNHDRFVDGSARLRCIEKASSDLDAETITGFLSNGVNVSAHAAAACVGRWRVGDHAGARKLVNLVDDRSFAGVLYAIVAAQPSMCVDALAAAKNPVPVVILDAVATFASSTNALPALLASQLPHPCSDVNDVDVYELVARLLDESGAHGDAVALVQSSPFCRLALIEAELVAQRDPDRALGLLHQVATSSDNPECALRAATQLFEYGRLPTGTVAAILRSDTTHSIHVAAARLLFATSPTSVHHTGSREDGRSAYRWHRRPRVGGSTLLPLLFNCARAHLAHDPVEAISWLGMLERSGVHEAGSVLDVMRGDREFSGYASFEKALSQANSAADPVPYLLEAGRWAHENDDDSLGNAVAGLLHQLGRNKSQ